jgi:CRP/FNR family transcriptional regulator, cyclic AMP receptor protein
MPHVVHVLAEDPELCEGARRRADTFALLDLRFAARVGLYPEVAGALLGRAMQRSRTLAVNMAIAHYQRTDRRLLLLFWHLADRWGRVTPDGIRLRLPVTHQLLADLVAARRPSVTSALQVLMREGLIERVDDGWLLHGEPPDEIQQEAWLEDRRMR